MEKSIFIFIEIILCIMAVIGICMGEYISIFAPLIVLGFYKEEKIIAFEDKLLGKIKGCVSSWTAKN